MYFLLGKKMADLTNILWNLRSLRFSIIYNKDITKIMADKFRDKNKLDYLFSIEPEILIKPDSSIGSIFEVGNLNIFSEKVEKLELHSQPNRVDFRLVFNSNKEISVEKTIETLKFFLDKVLTRADDLNFNSIVRLAVGIELEKEQSVESTIKFIPQFLDIDNVSNEYIDILIRVNKEVSIKNLENDLKVNQVVHIEHVNKFQAEQFNGAVFAVPQGVIKQVCDLKLDINTDPVNGIVISDFKGVTENLYNISSNVLNVGLKQ